MSSPRIDVPNLRKFLWNVARANRFIDIKMVNISLMNDDPISSESDQGLVWPLLQTTVTVTRHKIIKIWAVCGVWLGTHYWLWCVYISETRVHIVCTAYGWVCSCSTHTAHNTLTALISAHLRCVSTVETYLVCMSRCACPGTHTHVCVVTTPHGCTSQHTPMCPHCAFMCTVCVEYT